MKRSRFTQEQIIGVLKEHQAGAAADLCRKHGVSDATFYKWRSKGIVNLYDIGRASAGSAGCAH